MAVITSLSNTENHLAIRTKTAEALSDVSKTIDFTDPLSTNVLTNGSIGNYWKSITYTIAGSTLTKKVLNVGDANRNGSITGSDKLTFANQNGQLTLTYFTATADFNMNGSVTGFDKLMFDPNNGILQPNLGQ